MQVTSQIPLEKTDEIIDRYEAEQGALIQILQDITSEYNYLPEPCIRRIGQRLDVPLSDVFEVTTFYRAFSLEPRGKHVIQVCLGTACHVRGVLQVLNSLERCLNLKASHTSKDRMFTLETVNCLGACALGPVLVMDGQYHGQMTPAKVKTLLETCTESP